MAPVSTRPYRGVFPVAPTIFDDRGELDLDGQRRCIDFMIDAGSHGICILANFSEQFVLTDAEREQVMDAVLKHVAGRVPVIVTTTHFSSSICAARSRQAQQAGAAMVMIMPPYHGATFRVSEKAIFEFFSRRLRRHRYPDHDPGCAGGGNAALGRLAGPDGDGTFRTSAISRSRCRWPRAKLRDLIAAGGDSIVGPWDGEEAITLMADLDAGATGAMTGGGYPDGIRQIMDPYFAGRRDEAAAAYARWLPLINYENRQCGLQACKILMKEGGVIGSDAVRHPLQKLHPATRAGLIDIARSLDPVVLRWGR